MSKKVLTDDNRYDELDELDSPYEPSQTSSATSINPSPFFGSIVLDPTKPLSPYQNKPFPRRRPPGVKKPWTKEETDALEKGMIIFGNDWKAIKAHFSEELANRTNVNLKDRARNVKKKLQRTGADLGIWDKACK